MIGDSEAKEQSHAISCNLWKIDTGILLENTWP